MTISNTGNLTPAVEDYYSRLVLMTAYQRLIYGTFAQKRTLPEKSGKNIVFGRYTKLETVPVPLENGITGPGAPFDTQRISAQIKWYGNHQIITDQVQLTVEDQVVNQSARLLAQNMAATIDEITRDVLASTSSVIQCSAGSNGQTPTELTREDINFAVKSLLGRDADMIGEVITATDGVSTAPVRDAFFSFVHTDLLDDLEAVEGFKNTAEYPQQKILPSEWGSVGNMRFLYSSVGSKSDSSPEVYNNIVVGKEAYGAIHLSSEGGKFYVKGLGSGGSVDPVNQRSSVGFKVAYASRILNDAFMVNMMSTHS